MSKFTCPLTNRRVRDIEIRTQHKWCPILSLKDNEVENIAEGEVEFRAPITAIHHDFPAVGDFRQDLGYMLAGAG